MYNVLFVYISQYKRRVYKLTVFYSIVATAWEDLYPKM